MLGKDAALMHFPLTLAIGRADAPNRIGFLVSIIFVLHAEGNWRIQSLLTTGDKDGLR